MVKSLVFGFILMTLDFNAEAKHNVFCWEVILYITNEKAINIYKNRSFLFIYEQLKLLLEKEIGQLGFTPYLQIYTRLQYISREPRIFMLISQETDTEPASQPRGQIAPLQPYAQMAWLVYSADCSPRLTARVENFFHYIFFWCSYIFPMQFMWHFCCLLFTLRHSCTSCFWNPQTNWLVRGQYVTVKQVSLMFNEQQWNNVYFTQRAMTKREQEMILNPHGALEHVMFKGIPQNLREDNNWLSLYISYVLFTYILLKFLCLCIYNCNLAKITHHSEIFIRGICLECTKLEN